MDSWTAGFLAGAFTGGTLVAFLVGVWALTKVAGDDDERMGRK